MAIDKLTTFSLSDNSVTTDKIAPGAVQLADIPDGEITMAKLSQVDLTIAPEVLEIQVDAPASGQDTAWLWTWEQSTLPYARRTITNSNELQVPLYKQGTYVVNNFAAYTTHAQMTQTHSLYLKWIDGAGTDNLVSWATSAGPISDTHPDINGGAATNVQRITVNVPATITPPTLTAPSVSYTVANNGAGAYTFSGSAEGDNPNLGPFYRGGTYTINISATGHPFYFTTDNGTNFSAGTYFGEYTSGVTGSRTDSGTITFTVPSNAPDTLYYQCGNHSVMRGAITVKNLAVETNINGNYVVYFQHTQEGHKTPVELRPIPSLVNQMCLVYDAATDRFVPQDLATYVENTPSFENKIREVAGTAELVVEDGSAVVAKVNVYDDSTYLPLTGNNAGDQAFATDNNVLYIWDGSAWQQAGSTNSDDLTEGTTNLFYTDAKADARVVNYLTSNGYNTATNIIATITDSAPTTLDTLNELAAALGDDPNFATTVTNSIATKLATADFDSTFDTRFATKTLGGSLEGAIDAAVMQYGTAFTGTPAQGSFFFDSLNQKLKVYTGSTFVDAVPAGSGGGGGGGSTDANATFRKYTYSITSGTNAVTGADDNAETLSYVTDGTQNVEVYRNGIKMVEGASNDYVATTGTSVTFTYNLESGDTVDIQVYELLTNDAYYLKTETYTRTETNTNISTAVADYLPLTGGNITGNLGVGTASPDSRIEVSGTGNTQIKVTKSDDGTETVVLSQEGEGWIGTQSNHPLKFGTAYSAKMYLDTAGNFGINTNSPTDKLHVNGTTRLGSTTYINGKPSSSLGALNVVQTNNTSDNGIAVWDNTNARTMRLWVDSTDAYIYSGGAGNAELHINGATGVTTVAGALHANGSLRLPISTTDPGSPSEGKIYYNSTSKSVKVYDGSDWVAVGGNLKRVSTFDIFSDGSTVALYNLDGNGNDVGGNYNLTGDTGSSNFVAGKFGQAFNGTGTTHLYRGSNDLRPAGAHSVSFWYKSSSTGQGNKRLVTLAGTTGGTAAGWNNYNGSLGFYIGNGGTSTVSVTRVAQIPDSQVNDGQWHHLVYTVTSGGTSTTWKIYLDGSEYSGAVNGEGRSFNNNSSLAITTYDGGDAYNTIGHVDQVRILNRVITATEVEQLYNAV